jgi:FixJ family two-component response regulator
MGKIAISRKQLIAIIDDEIAIRRSLKCLLQSLDHSVSTFGTAEEYLASDLMRETGCLISDIQLPGISGADLQARLIANGHCIPIVFLTGFFSEHIRARVLTSGAIDYLVKPCNPKVLIDCIEKALAMSNWRGATAARSEDPRWHGQAEKIGNDGADRIPATPRSQPFP